MKLIGKLLFPVTIALIGIALVWFGYSSNQNWQFKLGSFSVVAAGIFFVLNVLDVVTKVFRLVVFAALVLLSLGLTYYDYKSIKDPIDFMNESKRRYVYVIQRLKDIRSAELAFKTVNGKYSGNFDSLITFVNNGKFSVIKAIGNVPDTLTEEQAVKMGLVKRDTSYISVKDSVFSEFALKGRTVPFYLDSIGYVPFGNGAKIELNAGQIERNKVNVQVFEAIAKVSDILYDLDPTLVRNEPDIKVGSMTDPNTNGNWGE